MYSTNAIIIWLEEKNGELLERLADHFNQEEVKNSKFPKMGNTETAKWQAQIEVLDELYTLIVLDENK